MNFFATKYTISKFAFILLIKNQEMSLILIILGFQRIFMNTFSRYQRTNRMKITFITMDYLYKPYYVLIQEFFPKATLIPDKFHIVLQIRNTFDYKLSNN